MRSRRINHLRARRDSIPRKKPKRHQIRHQIDTGSTEKDQFIEKPRPPELKAESAEIDPETLTFNRNLFEKYANETFSGLVSSLLPARNSPVNPQAQSKKPTFDSINKYPIYRILFEIPHSSLGLEPEVFSDPKQFEAYLGGSEKLTQKARKILSAVLLNHMGKFGNLYDFTMELDIEFKMWIELVPPALNKQGKYESDHFAVGILAIPKDKDGNIETFEGNNATCIFNRGARGSLIRHLRSKVRMRHIDQKEIVNATFEKILDEWDQSAA